MLHIIYNTSHGGDKMATKKQISDIIMLRGLGFSQQEIAEHVSLSRQAVAYQLQKLKSEAVLMGSVDTFRSKCRGIISGSEVDIGLLEEEALEIGKLQNIGEEVVKQTIVAELSEQGWVVLPKIHFKLASTFLQLEGTPADWRKGWPAELNSKLGWKNKMADELKRLMGSDIELELRPGGGAARLSKKIAVDYA